MPFGPPRNKERSEFGWVAVEIKESPYNEAICVSFVRSDEYLSYPVRDKTPWYSRVNPDIDAVEVLDVFKHRHLDRAEVRHWNL